MSLFHRRLATIVLLSLFVTGGMMAFVPLTETIDDTAMTHTIQYNDSIAESLINVNIPYVDAHIGYADGIIDPTEYAIEYEDPLTGITVYLEHNGTVLYVGLSGPTSGWMAFGWKNYTSGFNIDGLNGSDLIFGYSPGEPTDEVRRVLGSDAVTVDYILALRNGSFFQDGTVPNDESTTPISEEGLLQAYKDAIIGMRIGEVRYFIIPAEEGYTKPTDELYGEDLHYLITLSRIGSEFDNPADSSDIVYSYEHGVSTYQHLPAENQDRIRFANGSDDGSRTQLEYFIRMESDDGISILNDTDLQYPMMLMFGNTEDTTTLPVQHSDWSNPIMTGFIPNEKPILDVASHEQDAVLNWVAKFEVNATDNTYVRSGQCQIDDGEWFDMRHNFETDFWEITLDLSIYDEGPHVAQFKLTDVSNYSSFTSLNFSVDRPYVPYLGMRVDVDRTLTTESFHATLVADRFIIRNNGSAPLGAIEMYLPGMYTDRFLTLTATDQSDNSLEVVRLDDYYDMMHWRIHFSEPISYDETYVLTTSMSFHSLHTLTDYDDDLYEVSFSKYPVIPYVINKFSLTVDADTTLESSPDTTTTNLEPMSVEDFTFEMESFTPLIVGYRTTEVTMDAWGWMNYHETITLDNIGPSKENILLFTVPSHSIGVKIYDHVGVLAASQPGSYDWNKTLNLQINLRTDRFGEDGFYPGYSYTFNIDYSIQAAAHQTIEPEGGRVELPMGTMGYLLVAEHIIDVVVPHSLAIADISDDYRLLYGVFDSTYRFTAYNTTVDNPASIFLTYQISLGVASRPLLFSSVIGIIALIYVVFRKVEVPIDTRAEADSETPVDTRPSGAPPELLKKFATLYSRKTALNIDLEKLESSRRRGKVKKREYMIRERDIKSQIEKIDQELPGVRDELIGYGARYRDLIGQLELENEKTEGAKAGLRQLLRRKKKQQISRAAFEKIRQDYLKTIKKATSATDRILLAIHEEAGDL